MNPLNHVIEIKSLGKHPISKVGSIVPNVYWQLGNICTYECSYCPTHLHSGTQPYIPADVILNALNYLPKAKVTFGGGEPTYHPEIERIIDEKPDHIEIGFLSNGARPISFWQRVASKLFFARLSYHSEFANLDRFLKTSLFLKEIESLDHDVYLLMNPKLWDHCITAYKTFKDHGVSVVVKPIFDDFSNGAPTTKPIEEYTLEQIQWMKDHASDENNIKVFDKDENVLYKTSATELLVSFKTNFKGWRCYAPMHNILVQPSGDVYTVRCKQRQLIGDIRKGFKVPTEPVICHTDLCWCLTDIASAKEKITDQ